MPAASGACTGRLSNSASRRSSDSSARPKHIRAVIGIGFRRGGFPRDLSGTGGDGRECGLFGHLGGGTGKRCGFGGLSGNARRRGTKLRRKRFQLAAQGIAFRKQRLDVAGDRRETLRSCSAAPSARCSKATTRSLRRLKASSSRIIRSSISWPHEGSACGTAALTERPAQPRARTQRPIRAVPGRFRQRLGNLIRRYGRGQRFRRFLNSPFRRGLGLLGKAGFGFSSPPPLLGKPAWEPP